MAKRLTTAIGDIFSIQINENAKRFFQLVAFDPLQLNSDVIRCFSKSYALDISPEMESIVSDEVLFYAHCATKLGLNMNVWTKVGKSKDIGNPQKILFRGTDDYGTKLGESPISTSSNWYVWQIGDEEFSHVGKLEGKNKNSYVGLIINPLGILELSKGNKYPVNYPD